MCATLVCASLPAVVLAQSPCPGTHVKTLNIIIGIGTVACALFESPDGFPHEFLHSATNVMVIKIRKTQAHCDFEDILLGIPKEGVGFSNGAKGFFGAPSFSAASFPYKGEPLDLMMSLRY